MTTTAQTWIRAELIAAGSTPFGPQLMIPADGLEFHGTDLVFHCQGEVVYVAEAGQLRSVTWIGKQTDAETSRRKAQWPKRGVRWTDEERGELRDRLLAGEAWSAIAKAHGRSRTGVQQEALKQGWVSADTYQVKEVLAELSDAEAVQQDAVAMPETVAAEVLSAPAEDNTIREITPAVLDRRQLTAAVAPPLTELNHSDPEPARDRDALGTAITEPAPDMDTGPGLDPPLPRSYNAIPAPRSRPELTAGPWAES
jgi:hypothetical protein